MRKKKLLIIDKHQFGTLTDSYKWCENLRENFDIRIITPKGSNKTVFLTGVKIIRVPGSNRFVFGMLYTLQCLINLIFARGAILVVYFGGCSFFKKLLPWKKMILDIRTLSVDPDEKKRTKYNKKIIHTCRLYDYITCISEGVCRQLRLRKKHCSILPLGADPLCSLEKNYLELRLLYVGTLTGRNINQTIEGIKIFRDNHPEVIIKYEIVGDGWHNELKELETLTQRLGLQDAITIHGKLPYSRLPYFFNKCNVGISYIPMTQYFDFQPPTKTFEYISSGLVCIATSTFANKEIVNDKNGVLIKDSPESFSNGLEYIYKNRATYTSHTIASTTQNHRWNIIVQRDLYPILLKFCQ